MVFCTVILLCMLSRQNYTQRQASNFFFPSHKRQFQDPRFIHYENLLGKSRIFSDKDNTSCAQQHWKVFHLLCIYLIMLDFKEVYLQANKHNHSYTMNQQITQNFVLNISTSMTHCCKNNWWTPLNQVGYSPLFNVEQNFLKQLIYPTPPGDGQTKNKIVGERRRRTKRFP